LITAAIPPQQGSGWREIVVVTGAVLKKRQPQAEACDGGTRSRVTLLRKARMLQPESLSMPIHLTSRDRRRLSRGTRDGGPPRAQIVEKIVGEYHDMPGLSLNLRQAARLFGIGQITCHAVLEDLVRGGQLQVQNGLYKTRWA